MTLSEAIRVGATRRGQSHDLLIAQGPDGTTVTDVFGAAYEGTFGTLPALPTDTALAALAPRYPELRDAKLVHALVKLNHDCTREEIADWLERRG